MNLRLRLTTVAAITALVTGAGAGSAIAQTGPPNGAPPAGAPAGKPGGKHGPRVGLLKSAAEYLGLDGQELRGKLRGGKSLAQVATELGKSVSGLKQAILADAKEHLDKAVADGKVAADKAKAAYEKLQANVDKIVNQTGRPGGAGRGKGEGGKAAAIRGVMHSASKYLDITPQELRAKLREGKSLAQVATSMGKSVDGLKQAIVADAKTVIGKLVSEGKISAERGQQYLAQVQSKIDDIVNRTGPAK